VQKELKKDNSEPLATPFLHRGSRRPGRRWSGTVYELNLQWIYQLGGDTRPLLWMREATTLSFPVNVQTLTNARAMLESLLNTDEPDMTLLHRMILPNSRDKAVVLMKEVDTLLDLATTRQWEPFTVPLKQSLNAKFLEFEEALQKELGRAWAFIVTEQRMISVRSMMEKPEELFAERCWEQMCDYAKHEARDGACCLAFDCFTASGFHFLRAVEAIIKQYMVAITKTSPTTLPHKRDWNTHIDFLRQNGADSKVVAGLDQIRSAERNPLMHPEDVLNRDEAVDLMMLCCMAINRQIGDMKKRGLL